jgi:hypothetical protein
MAQEKMSSDAVSAPTIDLKTALPFVAIGLVEAAMWTLMESLPEWFQIGTVIVGLLFLGAINIVRKWKRLRYVPWLLGALYVVMVLYALLITPRSVGKAWNALRGNGAWLLGSAALLVCVIMLFGNRRLKRQVELGRLERERISADHLREVEKLETEREKELEDLQKLVHDLRTQQVKPLAWNEVFKVQRMKADPVSTDPGITFKNKLRMDLTSVRDREIYVWMPLWESSLVPSQADPTGSRLMLERYLGSWIRGEWAQYEDESTTPPKTRNLEHCCVKLRPDTTFESYVGLRPHAQDSIEGLLKRHGTIGTILFPVKIDGKIYEVGVPAREV